MRAYVFRLRDANNSRIVTTALNLKSYLTSFEIDREDYLFGLRENNGRELVLRFKVEVPDLNKIIKSFSKEEGKRNQRRLSYYIE